MTIEEAKVCLKGIKIISKDIFTEQKDLQDSLDIAIRCLDMLNNFDEELDKHYTEKEGKVQDNLAEGFMQCEKLVKRRIKEIEKESD